MPLPIAQRARYSFRRLSSILRDAIKKDPKLQWFLQGILLWTGQFVSPNFISVFHTVLVWFGYFGLYCQGYLVSGFLMTAFAGLLDKLDGVMARIFDKLKGERETVGFWPQFWHRGITKLGKWLDPLMDKLAIGPILLWISFQLSEVPPSSGSLTACLVWLNINLIAATLVFDIMGQALRLERFNYLLYKEDTSATPVGKIKNVCQWLPPILFMPWQQGWIHSPWYLIPFTLATGSVCYLGGWSLLSKLKKPIKK